MRVTITADKSNQHVYRLMREWPERNAALYAWMAFYVSQDTLELLLKEAPRGPAFKAYREGLYVAHVSSGLTGAVSAIRLRELEEPIGEVDAAMTAIYVTAIRRAERVDPAARILEANSPWTWATLPYEPEGSVAKLTARRVRRGEAAQITKDRNSTRSRWGPALRRHGVALKRPTGPLTGSVDHAFNVARMELGRTVSGRAHWRPALESLQKGLLKRYASRHPELVDILSNPHYKGYRRRPVFKGREVPPSEARSYRRFQKLLGY